MWQPYYSARAQGYDGASLRADAMAGLVTGIVALPLSMALAIAAGVPPQHGLYTAIVAGGLVALAGGSNFQVTGPTAAFTPTRACAGDSACRGNRDRGAAYDPAARPMKAQRTLEHEVAALRARCEAGPVGRWSSCAGSFEAVMNETLEFRDDGTGVCVFYGAFGHEQERLGFVWRSCGPWKIAVRVDAADDGPADATWETVCCDFGAVTHDAGTEPVMHLPAASLAVLAPLRFLGP